jgi:hypothetical protein
MATSTQSQLFRELTYSGDIKDQIVSSGGTIIFMRDNVIVASEISEAQYRELLNSSYIEKLDVLPLKRYGNVGVQYTQNTDISDAQGNAEIDAILNFNTYN